MNPILLQVIYISIIFFLALFLAMILKLGGKTYWQYIKSKLPGFKHKGAWFIQSGTDRKVKFVYKVIPDDLRIKIKAGEVPEDDQYATINEIFHQTEADGVPVIFTLEDLPFSFFLKKHHLDDFFPAVDEMVSLIDEIAHKKLFDEADKLKQIIKSKLNEMKLEVKYIPAAMQEINNIFAMEKDNKYKDKHSIILLLDYKKHLLKLKESIIDSNHQLVNVNDLFQTIGFAKNLTKIAFMEWQNGFLAAKQTKMEKKFNTWLIVMVVIVGILVLVGVYMTNQLTDQLEVAQSQISQTNRSLIEIKQMLGITVSDQTVIDTNLPVPPNPLQ